MTDKVLERRYLNRALELLELRPVGQVESSETPDFLVPLAGDKVGIEVTAFYLLGPGASQSHQARVGVRRIAVEQAQRLFRSQGGPALYVTVSFVSDRPLSKPRAYELGPILAHAVAATSVPTSIHDPFVGVDIRLLPPEVASISVAGSVNTKDELWHSTISGWVAPIERSHIEAEIARKAKRLPAIREKCSTAWLIIVNDGFRGSAMCELSAEARAFRFSSPFDKTLWLDSSGVYDLGGPGIRSR